MFCSLRFHVALFLVMSLMAEGAVEDADESVYNEFMGVEPKDDVERFFDENGGRFDYQAGGQESQGGAHLGESAAVSLKARSSGADFTWAEAQARYGIKLSELRCPPGFVQMGS